MVSWANCAMLRLWVAAWKPGRGSMAHLIPPILLLRLTLMNTDPARFDDPQPGRLGNILLLPGISTDLTLFMVRHYA